MSELLKRKRSKADVCMHARTISVLLRIRLSAYFRIGIVRGRGINTGRSRPHRPSPQRASLRIDAHGIKPSKLRERAPESGSEQLAQRLLVEPATRMVPHLVPPDITQERFGARYGGRSRQPDGVRGQIEGRASRASRLGERAGGCAKRARRGGGAMDT